MPARRYKPASQPATAAFPRPISRGLSVTSTILSSVFFARPGLYKKSPKNSKLVLFLLFHFFFFIFPAPVLLIQPNFIKPYVCFQKYANEYCRFYCSASLGGGRLDEILWMVSRLGAWQLLAVFSTVWKTRVCRKGVLIENDNSCSKHGLNISKTSLKTRRSTDCPDCP